MVDTKLLELYANQNRLIDYCAAIGDACGPCTRTDCKINYNSNPFSIDFIPPAEVERTMNLEFLMGLMPNPKSL